MHENLVSAAILDAAIEVHRQLGGPGLIESVYEEALEYELLLRGLSVVRQQPVPIKYKGVELKTNLRLDMLVEDKVIVECKATTQFNDVYMAQILTYLRLTNRKLGIIVNFGAKRIKDGFYRVVKGL